MATKQGKDRKAGAGVRSTGQGSMDKGITEPTNAAGAKSAAQSQNRSSGSTATRSTPTPGAAQWAGPSRQGASASQAVEAATTFAGNATASAAPKSPPLDKVQALGHALWLMTQSPAHRHMFVADMEWLLIAPVSLGQFRLWRQGNQPVGFVTWAFVSDEVDARLRRNEVKLRPQDWKSGDKAWVIDMIMPYGGTEMAISELKEQVFKTFSLHILRVDPTGRISASQI